MSEAPPAAVCHSSPSAFRNARSVVAFGAVYLACCEAGHALSFPHVPFATFWPAAGLFVAVLAMTPGRDWPRLVGAALVANAASNVIHDQSITLNLAFCAANALEAVIGALALRGLRVRFGRESAWHDVVTLAIAGSVAAVSGASIGTAAVAASGGTGVDLQLWGIWWGADVVGILLLGPIVLSWWTPSTITAARNWSIWRSAEAAALLAGLVTLTYVIGSVSLLSVRSLPFRAFPILVWGAARFGIRGTSLLLTIFFAILVLLTTHGRGPFAAGAESEAVRIMALQLCAGVFAITFLSLASVIEDRDRAIRDANESRAVAESANAAKSRFLANMSHELRTPINGMVAMTGLVLESRLDPQQRERLTLVNNSADSLRSLVNDILDVSKAEAGRLQLRPIVFSLRSCIDDLLTLLRAQTEKQQIAVACRIQPDVPDVLLADKNRLRQVLSNLLGNAVKFTSAGSISVDVQVESRSADRCELHFCISDTGIGIAPEVQQRLFQPFEQGASSTHFGGTGLGLSIVKQLVDLMGGRVWLESEPGQGSRFHFTTQVAIPVNIPALPRRAESAAAPAKAPQASPGTPAPGCKVLLVEDDAVNAAYSRAILEDAGFQVSLASDGAQAVRLWRDGQYDLVLSDVRMPVLGGVELTKQIRSLEQQAGRHTPIITFTAVGNPEDRDACLQAGADGFLVKPLKQTELVSVVADLLHRG